MLVTKTEQKDTKFQSALEYLIEYQGVKGALILDKEGLVIDYLDKDNIDPEEFSPLALLILDQTSNVLGRLNESAVKSIVLKNQKSWITIECVEDLRLVVRADLNTDDLLRVRIGQAVEMIKTHLKDRYPLLAR